VLSESDIYNLIIALFAIGVTMVWGKERKDKPKANAGAPEGPSHPTRKQPGFIATEAEKVRKTSVDKQREAKEEKYWSRQNTIAAWATVISGAALLFLIIASFIAYCTLQASNKAVMEAHNQAIEAKNQTAEAKRQANAAEEANRPVVLISPIQDSTITVYFWANNGRTTELKYTVANYGHGRQCYVR
jgi:hypothetical protein